MPQKIFSLLAFAIALFYTSLSLGQNIPLTTNDLNIKTAINSNNVLIDVLSNDDSGIINDDFKEVIGVCAINVDDENCNYSSYSDSIGTISIAQAGDANNVTFTASHDSTAFFEFKYIMQNSSNNTGSAFVSVNLEHFEVNDLNDGAISACTPLQCSIRDAFNAAAQDNEPSTIKFSESAYGTLVLNSQLLITSNDLSIIGPGVNNLTLSGNNAMRVVLIPGGTERFFMSNLTVADGGIGENEPGGAGILIQASTETSFDNIRVTNNNSMSEGGGIAAIQSGLTLTNSEVSFNTADENGGGIALIGGFGNDVNITNTTFSNNQSGLQGGGMYTQSNPGQNITLNFVTAAFNDGFLSDNYIGSNGNIILESSLFSGLLQIDNINNVTNNTISQNTSGSLNGENNLDETESLGLSQLQSVGRSELRVHTFEPSSLAYNHVDPMVGNSNCGSLINSDQIGTARPVDGFCDAGAYEYVFIDEIFTNGFE